MKCAWFTCNNKECGKDFEMFRFGNERLDKWKTGEKTDPEVKCEHCGSTDVKLIEIPKGSGQFKKFPVYNIL